MKNLETEDFLTSLPTEHPWGVYRFNGKIHYIQSAAHDWDSGTDQIRFACGMVKQQVRFVKESDVSALNSCPSCRKYWITLNRQRRQNVDSDV